MKVIQVELPEKLAAEIEPYYMSGVVKIVVCDTGPVLHLSEAGALGLIEKTGEVLVPAAVDAFVHCALNR